jgi:hypothetical protein
MLQIKCKDGRTPPVMADKNRKTILHHVCEKGDVVLVEKLVTAGAVKGYTPLHYFLMHKTSRATHLFTMLVKMATLGLHNYL